MDQPTIRAAIAAKRVRICGLKQEILPAILDDATFIAVADELRSQTGQLDRLEAALKILEVEESLQPWRQDRRRAKKALSLGRAVFQHASVARSSK